MPTARATFQKFIQDTQDYESFDQKGDHMVSRLFFTLEVGGHTYDDMYVEVRQPAGTRYEQDPLEVSKPYGSYEGNWGHHKFADLVENYCRDVIGAEGRAFKFSGSTNIRTRNNTFVIPQTVGFEIPG